MPFKSEAQRRFMWARHPEMAREFADATPKGTKLPYHVAGSKAKKKQTKKADDEATSPTANALGAVGNFLVGTGIGSAAASPIGPIARRARVALHKNPFQGDSPAVDFLKKPPLTERLLKSRGFAGNYINGLPDQMQGWTEQFPHVFEGQTPESMISRAADRYGSSPRASRVGAAMEGLLDIHGYPKMDKPVWSPDDISLFNASNAMREHGLGAVDPDIQRRLLAKEPLAQNYVADRKAIGKTLKPLTKLNPRGMLGAAAAQLGLGLGLKHVGSQMATPRGADIEMPPQAAAPTPEPTAPTAIAEATPSPAPEPTAAPAPEAPPAVEAPKGKTNYTLPIALGAGALGVGGLAAYLKHRHDNKAKEQEDDEEDKGDEPAMEMRKAAFIVSMDPQQQQAMAMQQQQQQQQQQQMADPNAAAMQQGAPQQAAAPMPDQPATVGQPQVAGAVAGPATVDPRNPGEAAGMGGMAPLQAYQGGLNSQIGGLKLSAADVLGANALGMRLIKKADDIMGKLSFKPQLGGSQPQAPAAGTMPKIAPPGGPAFPSSPRPQTQPATAAPQPFDNKAPMLGKVPHSNWFMSPPANQMGDRTINTYVPPLPQAISKYEKPMRDWFLNPIQRPVDTAKAQPWNQETFSQMIDKAPAPELMKRENTVDTSGSMRGPAGSMAITSPEAQTTPRLSNPAAARQAFNSAGSDLTNQMKANIPQAGGLLPAGPYSQNIPNNSAMARHIFNNPGGKPAVPGGDPTRLMGDRANYDAMSMNLKPPTVPREFVPTDGSYGKDPYAAYKDYMPGGNQGNAKPEPVKPTAAKPTAKPAPPQAGPARGGNDFWAGTKNVVTNDPGYLGASDRYYGSPSAYPSSHAGDPLYARFRPGGSTGSSVYGNSRAPVQEQSEESMAKGREFLEGLKERMAARQQSGVVASKPRLRRGTF